MIDSSSHSALLRAIRTKLGISLEELAKRLDTSFSTVNRWEAKKGTPQRAKQGLIEELARECGVVGADGTELADGAMPRLRRGTRTGSPTAGSTKSMEQMLWDAACSIRGEKDAPKFKDYLLPLLFLKRLSDVFDDEIDRLAQDYGDRATALEIAEADHSLVRFYLPPTARWAVISGRESSGWAADDKPRDIGEHLTKAVRAVVK